MRDTSQTKNTSEKRQKAASGLEENRARARTEAKRLKSSLFERSEFEDFSGADGLASDFLHSLDLFDSFLDQAKNECQIKQSGRVSQNSSVL